MLETATLVKLSMQAFCLCATVDSLKALEVLHPTALCFPSYFARTKPALQGTLAGQLTTMLVCPVSRGTVQTWVKLFFSMRLDPETKH